MSQHRQRRSLLLKWPARRFIILTKEETEVVKETTLATFKAKPEAFKEFRDELRADFAKHTNNYRAEATLYDDPELRTHEIKWGMSIDLNSCIGCGACVVACPP